MQVKLRQLFEIANSKNFEIFGFFGWHSSKTPGKKNLEKHEKASGQITTAQFKERIKRGMFYAESSIDRLKNDPKNANMNFDNFSIHC